VYGCIFQLYRTSNQALAVNLGLVVEVFAKGLGSETIPQEIQIEMVNMLKTLVQQHTNHMQQIIQSLGAQEQLNLNKFLTG